MNSLQTLRALELLSSTSEYWTEEEKKELSSLEKWIQDLRYIYEECEKREKQAGIITVEIKNDWRVIYTRELKDTLRAYKEEGNFPEGLNHWNTEAYREADSIHTAVLSEIGWFSKERS